MMTHVKRVGAMIAGAILGILFASLFGAFMPPLLVLLVWLLIGGALVGAVGYTGVRLYVWVEATKAEVASHQYQRRRIELAESRHQQAQDIELGRFKLDAWVQQQRVTADVERSRVQVFKPSQVVAEVGGGGMKLLWEPREQPQIEGPRQRRDTDEPAALPAPRPRSGRELLSQLRSDAILTGIDGAGEVMYQSLADWRSTLILGLPGGGKTSTACWYTIQFIINGGRFIAIDPQASSPDSLWSKIQPLTHAMDAPIGDTPVNALRAIRKARAILEGRLSSRQRQGPLLVLIDEITYILGAKETGGKWAQVVDELLGLLEDINTSGRRVNVFTLAIGQAANASRSGGSVVRDTFNTRIAHRMRRRQASMLGLTSLGDEVEGLGKGQVIIDSDLTVKPVVAQIPHCDDRLIAEVAAQIAPRRASRELGDTGGAGRVTGGVQQGVSQRRVTGPVTPMAPAQHAAAPSLPPLAQQVLGMKKSGDNKKTIVEALWGIKKNGRNYAEWKQAGDEYDQIVSNLTELGYL